MMKRRFLSVLAAGTFLVGGTALLAQTAPPPPRAEYPFFDEMDTDKDGIVTRVEVASVLDKKFAALDTDHNGTVTQTELQAEREQKFAERFAALDSDHNGQLSPAEFRTSRDRNGTPNIAVGDPRPHPGFHRGSGFSRGNGLGHWSKSPGGHLEAHHGNRDSGRMNGDITKDTFSKRALTHFDLLDSNDDGKITRAERDAARSGHRGSGTGPRPASSNR